MKSFGSTETSVSPRKIVQPPDRAASAAAAAAAAMSRRQHWAAGTVLPGPAATGGLLGCAGSATAARFGRAACGTRRRSPCGPRGPPNSGSPCTEPHLPGHPEPPPPAVSAGAVAAPPARPRRRDASCRDAPATAAPLTLTPRAGRLCSLASSPALTLANNWHGRALFRSGLRGYKQA